MENGDGDSPRRAPGLAGGRRGETRGQPIETRASRPGQVSKTGKEIKEYIESMAGEDPLLKGVPEDKNPFKEKGGCTVS
ncbi:guanine nucleotide-binding protein G(I)/G(S)/G(O) subunit gamma-T2-like [Onychostruthus taczanowskii]|uniref:guanine nucleotide-binding protein G(I)/G(S)/G(O) subunit gamma-T2-like n=1 Tax=Onychostruthus taczanowskii TaxID=356909 RepID=UPI001B807BFF|nr:guanine nucleotide-binding protein G(I)/G(S)/G(O) subunit gamma-T2-like [Onychostruthus taczanowskii]